MITLFTLGALVFTYPFTSDAINNFYDQKMMKEQLVNANEETRQKREARIEELAKINESLSSEIGRKNLPGIGIVEDPFANNITNNENPGEAYFRDHLLGAIYIPKIKVSLPIFDETNDTLLEKGSTLLQGTSYPIGGDDTHSVITSHSGLPEKRLFTDLEKLEHGDMFFIEIGDDILAYEIFDFNTVLPHEIESLAIQDGRDLVTLLTCTPYMINTHRLLVTGKRVDYQPGAIETQVNQVKNYHETRVFVIIGALAIFLALAITWAIQKYRFYMRSQKLYSLKFLLNGNDKQTYQLYSLLGYEVSNYNATSNQDGEVDFGLVFGKNYWIGIKGQKNTRFRIRAKIKNNSFQVTLRTGIFRKGSVRCS